jgi:hypothetical protein
LVPNVSKPLLNFELCPMERFFAALLLSPAYDFFLSEVSETKSLLLWETISKRVGLPVPTTVIKPLYANKTFHFAVRAALVLEEARALISQSLQKIWKRRKQDIALTWNAKVTKSYKSKGSQFFKVSFSIEGLKQDTLSQIRPASVFLCAPRECSRGDLAHYQLGVVTASRRHETASSGIVMLTCMFFRETDFPPFLDCSEWAISPLCRLITELRAFEAMTVQPGEVQFLQELLGKQRKKHAPITAYDDCRYAEDSMLKTPCIDFQNDKKIFIIPTLNQTQEFAASSFLTSDAGTITLVCITLM